VGTPGFRPEIWALGLRNPWRFSFDRVTGDLYIADVGQGSREEVDFQPAASRGGENYGWKVMEGTACFSRDACPASVPLCGAASLVRPILEYGHTGGDCSVTGGYVYRGSRLPGLAGTYWFGDFCSGAVRVAERQGGAWTVEQLGERAPGLTTFGEDRQGELYLGTLGGDLFRIASTAEPPPPPPPPPGKGDGVGLYDPAAARFHLKRVPATGAADLAVRFGPAGNPWLPLAGDWNGDGVTTIGFYDPAAGLFRLKDSLAGGAADRRFALAPRGPGWLPVVGDWDGDGDDGVGLYDPAASRFHLRDQAAAGPYDRVFVFGPAGAGWLPLAGDWDGDGDDTIGLYDPAASVFRLRNAPGGGPAQVVYAFGPPGRGWLPVAGDWDGDGDDTVGLVLPRSGAFRLENRHATPTADLRFTLSPFAAAWWPLAGRW
jgi:hypothetical protein